MSNLLAIDPAAGLSKGSSEIGVALFDLEKKEPIEMGVMTVRDAKDVKNRRLFLDRAQILVVENQFLGKNPQTLMALVEAREAWAVIARDVCQIPVYKMAPSEWQSRVQRRGRPGNLKNMEEIRFYIKARFGFIPLSDDELCAICIGAVFIDLLTERMVDDVFLTHAGRA